MNSNLTTRINYKFDCFVIVVMVRDTLCMKNSGGCDDDKNLGVGHRLIYFHVKRRELVYTYMTI